jgi:hypothetical protein
MDRAGVYFVDALPLEQVDEWLEQFRKHWERRLDALSTEIARGKRARRGADRKT